MFDTLQANWMQKIVLHQLQTSEDQTWIQRN